MLFRGDTRTKGEHNLFRALFASETNHVQTLRLVHKCVVEHLGVSQNIVAAKLARD